jgi:hypothetical protein
VNTPNTAQHDLITSIQAEKEHETIDKLFEEVQHAEKRIDTKR